MLQTQAFTAYGVRIRIRGCSSYGLDRIEEHLPTTWLRTEDGVADRTYLLVPEDGGNRKVLYADEIEIGRSSEAGDLIDALSGDMQLYVADHAQGWVFVHAGVVGWQGVAILLPAPSRNGKSTQVAALLRAGATYYSDEYAVLDKRGWVHPYARPLRFRDGNHPYGRMCTAQSLGSAVGSSPLPVGLVAVTRHHPGVHWRPRRLTPGKAVLELLANTVSARRQPATALQVLSRVVRGARILKGARGDADETAPLLLREAATARSVVRSQSNDHTDRVAVGMRPRESE